MRDEMRAGLARRANSVHKNSLPPATGAIKRGPVAEYVIKRQSLPAHCKVAQQTDSFEWFFRFQVAAPCTLVKIYRRFGDAP